LETFFSFKARDAFFLILLHFQRRFSLTLKQCGGRKVTKFTAKEILQSYATNFLGGKFFKVTESKLLEVLQSEFLLVLERPIHSIHKSQDPQLK
jgi:hypothetical protein